MNNKDVAVEINPLLVLFFTLELISMKIDLNHLNTHLTALEQDFSLKFKGKSTANEAAKTLTF